MRKLIIIFKNFERMCFSHPFKKDNLIKIQEKTLFLKLTPKNFFASSRFIIMQVRDFHASKVSGNSFINLSASYD